MSRPAVTSRKSAKSEYIETDSLNKVSRRTCISGTANITLAGRTVVQADVHLRGDLHRLNHPTAQQPTTTKPASVGPSISVGKCVVVSSGSVLRPPSRVSRGIVQFYPMKVGDHVFIGSNTHVSSISIASHVHISENCILHPFSIINQNVKILPNTIVPGQMVVPANSMIGGQPARVVGEVGEGWGVSTGGAGGEWVEGGELRELVRSI
ncbi:trimeric LpxA-like protein, partial [Pseudovirgaria hyperparasitica]